MGTTITTVFVIWLLAPTGDSFFYGIYRTMHRCHRAQQRILDHPDFHIQDGWGIIARECPLAKIGGKP